MLLNLRSLWEHITFQIQPPARLRAVMSARPALVHPAQTRASVVGVVGLRPAAIGATQTRARVSGVTVATPSVRDTEQG